MTTGQRQTAGLRRLSRGCSPVLAILTASVFLVVASCSRSPQSDPLQRADALFARGEYDAAKKYYLVKLTDRRLLTDQEAHAPELKAAWIGLVKCSANLEGPDAALIAVDSMFNAGSLGPETILTLEDLSGLRGWMAAGGFTAAANRVAEEIKSRVR